MNTNTISISEVERALLGALIVDPDTLQIIRNEGITANDFTDPIFKKIFHRITVHGDSSELLLIQSMPENQTEIMEMMANSVHSVYISDYCRKLKEYTARRETISACNNLIRKAQDTKSPFQSEMKKVIPGFLQQQNRLEVMRSRDMAEVFDDYKQFADQENGNKDIIPYGLPIDKIVRHSRGEIFTLGAAPGTGKTTFALSAMLNMARSGRKTALFCQEMPSDFLIARLVSNLSRVPIEDILAHKNRDLCRHAESEIQSLMENDKLYIRGSGDYCHTVAGIETELQNFYNRAGGVDWFCIDYIQNVRPDGRSKDRRESIDLAVEGIKQLAIEKVNAACLILSQLSRSGQQGETALTALKESSHIEEASSIVAFLKRTNKEEEIIFDIRKNRNGKLCHGHLHFETAFARFSEHPYPASDVPGQY